MNQADFLVSSSAKMAKPVKASSVSRDNNSTQDGSDFSSRLEHATGKNKQSSTKSKAVETEKKVSNNKVAKDAEQDSKRTDKASSRHEGEQTKVAKSKGADEASNAEVANNTSMQGSQTEPLDQDSEVKQTQQDPQNFSDIASSEVQTLSKQMMLSEIDLMQANEETHLQEDVPVDIEYQEGEDSTQYVPTQYVEGAVLDEGEEILSQLTNANQMLQPTKASMDGKELPPNDAHKQALMQSVAQYEAQQTTDITEFTAAVLPTKPLLSQLLDRMNGGQLDNEGEAYLKELAAKEGVNDEQLQLLQRAIDRVDIKQLQVIMAQDEHETAFLLENESALRDAFVIQILTQGQEDPQLEDILTQLKSGAYSELDSDLEQIPPKLMIELSAYVEAKQAIHQQIKAQEQRDEQSQIASDAFLLGTGYGAGLATAELTATNANSQIMPRGDGAMITPELYHQVKPQLNKQDITPWQLSQMQNNGEAPVMQMDPELFTAQLGQTSNIERQALASAQPQINKGIDFASQLAGLSSANQGVQDNIQSSVQNAGAKVANQQAIETPIRVAQQGQVAPELANKVNMMLSRDLKQVDIRLDPPELGRVHIKLALNNDQAHLNFTVTHAHARDAIEHSIPRLREMLAQQGVDLGQTNVDQEQSQARDFSNMLAGKDGSQSSQGSEIDSENVRFANDGDGEEIEMQVTSSSISDSAVDFYA